MFILKFVESSEGINGLETCGLSYSSPEIIARHELHDGETVLCLGDGKDCKPVQCFSMKIDSDDNSGP